MLIANSFRNKLLIALIAMVVITGTSAIVSVLSVSKNAAMEDVALELKVGEQVFKRALKTRGEQLSLTVNTLSQDFGFKQALAIGEPETIESMLLNHGARIDADLMLFLDRDKSVIANADPNSSLSNGSIFPFHDLLGAANGVAGERSVVSIDGKIYQVLVTSVFVPQWRGWLCIGFEIDSAMLNDFQSLTFLDLSITTANDNGMALIATTLKDMEPLMITNALQQQTGGVTDFPIQFGNDQYIGHAFSLGLEQSVRIYLKKDLEQILSRYESFNINLLSVFLVALAVSFLLAIVLSRGITNPILSLVDVAKRIRRGDYDTKIDITRSDEIGQLADTLNEMQTGIARREEKIRYQANHDILTGLPNRMAIESAMAQAVNNAQAYRRNFAVISIDLKRFKEINDTLGHDAGDEVLVAVSELLKQFCDDDELVARQGGDEFLLLVMANSLDCAKRKANQLVNILTKSYFLGDAALSLDLSMGMAVYGLHGFTSEELSRRVDIALHSAKTSGQTVHVYQVGQEESRLHKLSLIRDLGNAVQEKQLTLCYQPKVSLRTNQTVCVEALLRWQHPELGMVSPEEFIPLAEKSGLVSELTKWVLNQAVNQIAAWREIGIDMKVAVNISAIDLLSEQLPANVENLLRVKDIPNSHLCLEVTESAVMKDSARSIETLRRLYDLGITISIDDFGTGQASLAQLKRLPVHELKIDKSFVMDMVQNHEDKTIVRSTIELGHNMGLSVTAEGVENKEALNMLQQFHCDTVQGYFFSRPLSADDLTEWLNLQDVTDNVA